MDKNAKKNNVSFMENLKDWLIPLFSFLVIFVISLFVIYPWFNDIMVKRQQIQDSQTLLDQELKPKLSLLQSLDKSTLQNYLLTMELLVPSSPNVPSIFSTIEGIAAGLGLKVDSLSYSGFLEAKDKSEIKLSFSVSGGQDKLLNFSQGLNSTVPLLHVFKLSLLAKDQSSDGAASLSLSSPYYPIPQNLGPVSVNINKVTDSEKSVLDKLEQTFLQPLNSGSSAQITPTPLPSGKNNPF